MDCCLRFVFKSFVVWLRSYFTSETLEETTFLSSLPFCNILLYKNILRFEFCSSHKLRGPTVLLLILLGLTVFQALCNFADCWSSTFDDHWENETRSFFTTSLSRSVFVISFDRHGYFVGTFFWDPTKNCFLSRNFRQKITLVRKSSDKKLTFTQ